MKSYLLSAMNELKVKKNNKKKHKAKGFFNARKEKNLRQVADCDICCVGDEGPLSSYLQECPDC